MIRYCDVTKKFTREGHKKTSTSGQLTAICNLSLEIGKGEFFGLLGPNGAGKTTLIRLTTTLSPLSSGTIEIDGKAIDRNSSDVKEKIGIVPQYSNLDNELTAAQILEYHGRLYGMPKKVRRERTEELLNFADLRGRRNDKARTFSGGMQRKLMIAKALMHSPQILLLDEPTVGLDAIWRRRIWDLLRNLNESRLTIFLTTHYLEEAQTLCSRVGLIDSGKLKKTGTPQSIIGETGKFVLEYFKNGETVQEFFDDKDMAFLTAKKLSGSFKVREANLEDAFCGQHTEGY